MKNYYEILNVINFADIEVIKASYRALSKKFHPDINKNVNSSFIVEVNEAYEILKNESTRIEYNIKLKDYLTQSNKNNGKDSDKKTYSKSSKNEVTEEAKNENVILGNPNVVRGLMITLLLLVIFFFANYIFIKNISSDSKWKFVAYPIAGAIIGQSLRKNFNSDTNIVAFLSAVITCLCIVLPFYLLIFNEVNLIDDRYLKEINLIKTTSAILEYLLFSGWIRCIIVIITPICAFCAVKDND